MPLNYLDLGIAAQASAAKAVKAGSDAFTALQAQLADFQATGNPSTDWAAFNQSYMNAGAQYRQLHLRDQKKSGAPLGQNIPAALQSRLAELLAAKAPQGAAAPAPSATAEDPAPKAAPAGDK